MGADRDGTGGAERAERAGIPTFVAPGARLRDAGRLGPRPRAAGRRARARPRGLRGVHEGARAGRARRPPGGQHPPRAAAQLPGGARGARRDGARRQGHRVHLPLGRRRASTPARSSTSGPCGSSPTTPSRRCTSGSRWSSARCSSTSCAASPPTAPGDERHHADPARRRQRPRARPGRHRAAARAALGAGPAGCRRRRPRARHPRPVPHNALDEPWLLTVLPTSGEGWLGTPGYAAHRAGGRTAPRWVATLAGGDGSAQVRATASDVGVEVVLRYRLDEHGVLVVESSLTNTSDDPTPLDVAALRAVLPLPARADEVLDLTGRWCRERSPQRHPLADGTWLRTGRRGRTGHDATLLMVVGTAGFGFRSRRGVGRARRVERQPRAPRRAAARGRRPARRRARRRRGPGAGRGAPRTRGDLRRAARRLRALRRGARRADPLAGAAPARPAGLPSQPAAAGAQHLGGRLLRPPTSST